ncbi:hypothetical protein AVEN_10290-1 [Araneus ventricosus]|uniref:Uncharacterized protein n=1 Tax=Araneus ventricosus TaxID=182803 RepID=A0A4Y2THN9_ARAVE|nr:hypothetical protein AVEN_10290-1 [Araneus ventricosus]
MFLQFAKEPESFLDEDCLFVDSKKTQIVEGVSTVLFHPAAIVWKYTDSFEPLTCNIEIMTLVLDMIRCDESPPLKTCGPDIQTRRRTHVRRHHSSPGEKHNNLESSSIPNVGLQKHLHDKKTTGIFVGLKDVNDLQNSKKS